MILHHTKPINPESCRHPIISGIPITKIEWRLSEIFATQILLTWVIGLRILMDLCGGALLAPWGRSPFAVRPFVGAELGGWGRADGGSSGAPRLHQVVPGAGGSAGPALRDGGSRRR